MKILILIIPYTNIFEGLKQTHANLPDKQKKVILAEEDSYESIIGYIFKLDTNKEIWFYKENNELIEFIKADIKQSQEFYILTHKVEIYKNNSKPSNVKIKTFSESKPEEIYKEIKELSEKTFEDFEDYFDKILNQFNTTQENSIIFLNNICFSLDIIIDYAISKKGSCIKEVLPCLKQEIKTFSVGEILLEEKLTEEIDTKLIEYEKKLGLTSSSSQEIDKKLTTIITKIEQLLN